MDEPGAEDDEAPALWREVSNAAGSGFWLKAKPILVIVARALKKKNFSADNKSHGIAMQRKTSAGKGIFSEEKISHREKNFQGRKKVFEGGEKSRVRSTASVGWLLEAEGGSKFGVWQWGGVSSE